jgi:hypothetical protein
MTDMPQPFPDDGAIGGAPTWVRMLQAVVIGLVAGLALNALLSMFVVHGEAVDGSKPKQCRKAAPAHDASRPAPNAPIIGRYRWSFEGTQAHVVWPQRPTADLQVSAHDDAGN